MSHFSDIGLPIETENDMYDLVNKAIPLARTYPASSSQNYLVYSEPNGAELWIQIDADGDTIGVNPHFRGSSRRPVMLTKNLPSEDYPMDGAFYAWANPTGDEDRPGDYPFVFDVPDFAMHDTRTLPNAAQLQLAAFAHEITAYADEAAFDAAQASSEMQMASESFIPTGLFLPDDAPPGAQPEAYAMFVGTVKAAASHTTTLGGGSFHALLVETLGGDIDVVTSADLLAEPPKPGAIVEGSYWLSGRIISSDGSAE